MRLLTRLSCVFALFLIGGCVEVAGPQGEPVEITVRSWPAITRLSGVELCETDDAANCETTDSNGEATLFLPVNEETGFTAERQLYGSYLVPVKTPADAEPFALYMVPEAIIEGWYQDVPLEDVGRIACEITGLAGVTFDLFDDEGPVEEPRQLFRVVGLPPTYDEELTETTAAGVGVFLEISPGEYEVQVGGTAGDCVLETGWPPARFSEHTVRFPVRAGYTTRIDLRCSEKEL
jgi:hypothetical protein